MEYEDNIILYFNNKKIDKTDSKLNNVFNEEEKEVCLGIERKEYTEREILELLYNETDGNNWERNDNWLTDKPLSEWYGIEIHENSNSKFIIKEIDLQFNNLTGKIPKEIGKLIELNYLNLNENQLSGEIPKEIGKLTYLEELDLYDNKLTGEIPKEIGRLTNLNFLDLYQNKLSEEIPKEVKELKCWKDT